MPATPTGLTVTTVSASRIDLAWTSTEPRFDVQRERWDQDTSAWTSPTAFVVAGTSYSDTAVDAAAFIYRYRVRVNTSTSTPLLDPPAGWENYTQVDASGGGDLFLDNAKNYLIYQQASTAANLRIRGGGNVVVIGMDRNYTGTSWGSGESIYGLSLYDAGTETVGRIVHVEGCHFRGERLGQGLLLDAPTCAVQLVNTRIGDSATPVRFKNADARDGTNGLAVTHPDLIQQMNRGVYSLSIDGITGYAGYQGIFLRGETAGATLGPVKIRRADLHQSSFTGVEEDGAAGIVYYGGPLLWPYASTDSTQKFAIQDDVWLEHNPRTIYQAYNPDLTFKGSEGWYRSRYWNGTAYVLDTPATGGQFPDTLRTSTGRPTGLATGTDAQGTWAEFGHANITGRAYSGARPSGEVVPASSVGTSYRRPGWPTPPPPPSFQVAATRYTFETTVESWVGQSSTVVAHDTVTTFGGSAGSLKASKAANIIRPASPHRASPGVDWSAGGDTFRARVFVPSDFPGTGVVGRLEIVYYDAGGLEVTVAGSNKTLTAGQWNTLTLAKGTADLTRFNRLVVQVEVNAGYVAASTVVGYVDQVEQGTVA